MGPASTSSWARSASSSNSKIKYYATVNLGGFVPVVDTLGGVNVNVARGFCDPTYDEYGFHNGFSITAGRHHLNGNQALAYARVRKAPVRATSPARPASRRCVSGIRDSIVHGGFLNDPIGLIKAVGKTVDDERAAQDPAGPGRRCRQVGRQQTYRAVVTHPLVGRAMTRAGRSRSRT